MHASKSVTGDKKPHEIFFYPDCQYHLNVGHLIPGLQRSRLLRLRLFSIELSKILPNPYVAMSPNCSSSNLAIKELSNRIVILETMRENMQIGYSLPGLPFHFDQWPLFTWPSPPITTLMAIEFGYTVRVTTTEKIYGNTHDFLGC
jgi:hypothetical protein